MVFGKILIGDRFVSDMLVFKVSRRRAEPWTPMYAVGLFFKIGPEKIIRLDSHRFNNMHIKNLGHVHFPSDFVHASRGEAQPWSVYRDSLHYP